MVEPSTPSCAPISFFCAPNCSGSECLAGEDLCTLSSSAPQELQPVLHQQVQTELLILVSMLCLHTKVCQTPLSCSTGELAIPGQYPWHVALLGMGSLGFPFSRTSWGQATSSLWYLKVMYVCRSNCSALPSPCQLQSQGLGTTLDSSISLFSFSLLSIY